MTAEKQLAQIEDNLPHGWKIVDREHALREVLKPSGLIRCDITRNDSCDPIRAYLPKWLLQGDILKRTVVEGSASNIGSKSYG